MAQRLDQGLLANGQIRVVFALLLLSCLPVSTQAQIETWQRVFTGDDFTVDVNTTSLTLEPHVFRARFRTVLSKPETISSNSPTKYKTRLETIEFKTDKLRYDSKVSFNQSFTTEIEYLNLETK